MEYQVVELKEKVVVGYSQRTSNEDPNMQSIIGSLWQELYSPAHANLIQNRVNTHAIGLYSDYDETGYQVTVGFEVSKSQNGDNLTVKVIPAGKYAKFHIHGDPVEAVSNSWGEIWQTPLDRTFTGDFEEYLTMEDIDIYIAIK